MYFSRSLSLSLYVVQIVYCTYFMYGIRMFVYVCNEISFCWLQIYRTLNTISDHNDVNRFVRRHTVFFFVFSPMIHFHAWIQTFAESIRTRRKSKTESSSRDFNIINESLSRTLIHHSNFIQRLTCRFLHVSTMVGSTSLDRYNHAIYTEYMNIYFIRI